MIGDVTFSEQAKEKLRDSLKNSKVLERVFTHDIQVLEILQVESKYRSPFFGQTWILCRRGPYSTGYCVLTRDEENTYWRLVWLGSTNNFVPLLRHIVAECINEVYLEIGPLTFYIR